MSTRHVAAEHARLSDLTPEGSSSRASRRFRRRLAADGFTVDEGFRLKPGYLYTVVRAISARVNQNYDGWPSEELKKSYKTFIGKPVFVNHENHDPTKARGVVVAARYVENGPDRYIEVVQEVDAERFPKLAHEIKTGGLDSVSMGAEAGFTICSYCHNKATDLHDMCDHVRNHKGKTLTKFDRRTGRKEDVLVFESCHKISFFELSYVFEPADETAVASKVVVAGKRVEAKPEQCPNCGKQYNDWQGYCKHCDYDEDSLSDHHDGIVDEWWSDPDDDQDPFDPRIIGAGRRTAADVPEDDDWEAEERRLDKHMRDNPELYEAAGFTHGPDGQRLPKWNPETDVFDPRQFGASRRTAAEDVAVPAIPGTPTIPQSVIDNTPVVELSPATELTGQEAPGVPKQSAFAADIADILKLAGECPPGMDCSRNIAQGEQIGKDTPNNPVNQVSYTPGNLGQPGSAGSAGGGGGSPDADNILPGSRALYDQLMSEHPGAEIGGYRVDSYGEHARGALDFMTTDDAVATRVRERAFEHGAPYVIWQQKQWDAPWHNSGGVSQMEDRSHLGPAATQNHFDHVHIAPLDPSRATIKAPSSPQSGAVPAQREAGKYTKEDFAAAGGRKPWETDTPASTRAPVEDEDLREIEAMVRSASPARRSDDLRSNSNLTTALNTEETYRKAHQVMDAGDAPPGPRLDVGSGKVGVILADELQHATYEPFPHEGYEPDFRSADQVPGSEFRRVTNLNVLNVLPPKERRAAIRQIGRALAPGGHAVITVRKWRGDVEKSAPHPAYLDRQPDPVTDPRSVITGGSGKPRYQHGYEDHQELIDELQSVLGRSYAITPVKGKFSSIGVHVVKQQGVTARRVRSAALKKIARSRARRLAWGEKEAPMAVDTLREEGSAPEDDNDDDQRYVDPADDFAHSIPSPAELSTPDLSEAAQIDRQQEMSGQQTTGVPGPAEGGPPPEDQGNYITLKIPMPSPAAQAPQQPGPPPVMAQPPQQPITAALLDYFDGYYGRRVADWLDAVEAGRDLNPAEAADYRRQAARLSTLENGRELSTTNRNPGKEPANMARNSIANRKKVATAGRRQHFAEGPLVDGGDRSRNDQGEQEEAFISQTPPFVVGDYPDEDTHDVPNTENNLVARVQRGRDQLMRDAQQLAKLRQRRAFDEAGGPTATVVDPRVNTGPEGEKLTGDDFISADPNDGVVPTNPKDASLRAFQAFDKWLATKTGKSSRRHSEATIKKAAAQFSREAGISPQALFPALGIVLREARKNDKQANTKGAKMRKRSNESLDVAAPDGRIDVEAPVEDTTDAEAQASQFDLRDFGNNAGDNVAKPDLSTDQNWAPGEASKTGARVKTAGGLLAMRCAEGMIAAGLEPNSRERKYQLAAEFERMNRGLIQDRVALLERFAAVREADRRKVASGMSRGAARSPIPAGLSGGTRTASAPSQRVAAHDPRNDSSLFI